MRLSAFQDRGAPARTTNATVRITILDNDDLDPKFTRDVYKAKIYEFYPMPVSVFFFYKSCFLLFSKRLLISYEKFDFYSISKRSLFII